MQREVFPILYNRRKLKTGIVHIGIGNFHRAHQEYYLNKLLATPSVTQWGVCGLALLPSDEALVNKLNDSGLEYTLTIYGRKGDVEVQKIGSLVELIWGVKEPERALAKMASSDVKIISMTITEGGYNIDRKTGSFDFTNQFVDADIKSPTTPKSVFGLWPKRCVDECKLAMAQ